jgi:hypothetical protein
MNTDELINMLGTNLEPVKGGQLRNALMIALGVGAVAALCLMLAIFGLSGAAPIGEYPGLKVLALAFTLGLVGAGANSLIRSARPGVSSGKLPILASLLFLCILSASLLALALVHPTAWGGMIFEPQWAACLVCIPLLSAAPFASLVWALRKGAPTNLSGTGALAGLVAGALGATVLAFHHSAGSIPFIAFWYGGPILLCAVVGAILGPRLLRW